MIDKPRDNDPTTEDDIISRLASALMGVSDMADVHERIRENVRGHLPGATIAGLDEIYERSKIEVDRRQDALAFSYDILDMVETERTARGLVNDAFAPADGETSTSAPSKALTMVAHLLAGLPHILLTLTVDPEGHGHVQIGTNCDPKTVHSAFKHLSSHYGQDEIDTHMVDYENRKRAKRPPSHDH